MSLPSSSSIRLSINRTAPRVRRALLYLQGHDAKKVKKAASHPTLDCACLDMEDGVAVAKKAEARQGICAALNDASLNFGRTERVARINAFPSELYSESVSTTTTNSTTTDDPSSDWAYQDIDALTQINQTLPDAICIPKTETAQHVLQVAERLDALGDVANNVRIIGMIESPAALFHMPAICQAAPERLDMLILGGDDYAGAVGAYRTETGHELDWFRNYALAQAAVYGVSCIDTVLIDYHNTELLQQQAQTSCELGFVGKQVIHPKQIEPVQQAYSPTQEAIDYAASVVQASHEHQHGAFSYQGKMIDMPTVKQLQNLLQRAKLMGLYTNDNEDDSGNSNSQ